MNIRIRTLAAVAIVVWCPLSSLYAVDVKELAKQGKTIRLIDLPVVKNLAMSPDVRSFLEKAEIVAPQLVTQDGVTTISGGFGFKGMDLIAKVHFIPKESPETGEFVSLALELPRGFKLSAIDDKLKLFDIFSINKGALIFSEKPYKDTQWDAAIVGGVNLVVSIAAEGKIKKLVDLLPGTRLNQVQLVGGLRPELIGSKLSLALPGKIQFKTKALGEIAQSTGLTLNAYVTEIEPGVPDLTVSIKSGIALNVKDQVENVKLEGEIMASVTEIAVTGYTKGDVENAFGIKGLKVGDLTFLVRSDYATTAATGGILALSGFCLGGKVGVVDKAVTLKGCIEASESPDILIAGKIEGGISLKDIITFAVTMADRIKPFKSRKAVIDKITRDIPNIKLDEAELYVVPKTTVLSGKAYKKGVTIVGKGNWDKNSIALDARIDERLVAGQGGLNLDIGPFKITGKGEDGKMGTADDTSSLQLTIDLNETSPSASLKANGIITLDILDGLSAEGNADFSYTSLEGDLTVDLLNRFNATVKATGTGKGEKQEEKQESLKQLENWKLSGEFTKTGKLELKKLLADASQTIVEKAHTSLKKARNNLSDLDTARSKLDAEIQSTDLQIAELKKKDAELEQKNLRAIQKAQQEVEKLKQSKDKLDAAIAQCKGDKPNHAKDLDEYLAKQPAITPDEVQKAIEQYKQNNPDMPNELIEKALAELGAQG